ncbi:unnamed protein product [Linum trigynum]|uniref:Uncharacterized protein n=1 Tax=Linum trigynum TaxID=586398 RepID=A0AAV2FUT3_9ROSI
MEAPMSGEDEQVTGDPYQGSRERTPSGTEEGSDSRRLHSEGTSITKNEMFKIIENQNEAIKILKREVEALKKGDGRPIARPRGKGKGPWKWREIPVISDAL